MSRMDAHEPDCTAQSDQVELLITPKSRDLGDFSVRRVLPASAGSIGPFVFFDEMGPAIFPPGKGINVRPHPHIGLSTVTFLFDGEILHRDSLGYVQSIQPGAVNLMTAGRGIVHSERTSEELLKTERSLHGIQVWMALPDGKEEVDPAFMHYPKEALPILESQGITTTVIIGSYGNETSCVEVVPETLYLDQRFATGAELQLAPLVAQRAVYVVAGEVEAGTCRIRSGSMAVLSPGETVPIRALTDAHIMIIGGEPVSPRHLWWNFVHSSAERIEEAKRAWQQGEFDTVPGDDEFIPLPEQ